MDERISRIDVEPKHHGKRPQDALCIPAAHARLLAVTSGKHEPVATTTDHLDLVSAVADALKNLFRGSHACKVRFASAAALSGDPGA